MRLARYGDNQAFAALVDRHKDILVNYLTRVSGERHGAEDLAQEAFMRVFLNVNRYSRNGQFRGYLFRIATNLALSEHRKKRRRQMLFSLFKSHGVESDTDDSPQTHVLADEAHGKLKAAIVALPWRFRVPVVLREIEGLSYEAVASVLGCSVGTVKSRLSRGRRRLKTDLSPYINGEEL